MKQLLVRTGFGTLLLAACTENSEPPPGCAVVEDLGRLEARADAVRVPQAQPTPPANDDATVTYLRVAIGSDDAFELALWDSYGAFGDVDITTGVFTIAGAEAQNVSCGICARILGDLADGQPTQRYIAVSGTLTLTSVTDRLVGTAADLELKELDEGAASGGPLPDGCTTHVDEVRVDVPIVLGAM